MGAWPVNDKPLFELAIVGLFARCRAGRSRLKHRIFSSAGQSLTHFGVPRKAKIIAAGDIEQPMSSKSDVRCVEEPKRRVGHPAISIASKGRCMRALT